MANGIQVLLMTSEEVERVNSFIPIAEKFAYENVALYLPNFSEEWTKIFHQKMDELAIEHGLRVKIETIKTSLGI